MSITQPSSRCYPPLEEGWNQGKVAVFDERGASDLVYHDPAWPDVHNLEDYKRYVTQFRSAFPDLHMTIEDMIAEGDRVVVRWTMHGTHTGDIVRLAMHVPATGKQVTVMGITIDRFAGGKVVEIWMNTDTLGFYQQLGLIPVPQPVG